MTQYTQADTVTLALVNLFANSGIDADCRTQWVNATLVDEYGPHNPWNAASHSHLESSAHRFVAASQDRLNRAADEGTTHVLLGLCDADGDWLLLDFKLTDLISERKVSVALCRAGGRGEPYFMNLPDVDEADEDCGVMLREIVYPTSEESDTAANYFRHGGGVAWKKLSKHGVSSLDLLQCLKHFSWEGWYEAECVALRGLAALSGRTITDLSLEHFGCSDYHTQGC